MKLTWKNYSLDFLQKTYIMGILNVTPDSFSDGGRFLDEQSAVQQAIRMVKEGADIIDIGGESTRPGADPVSAKEEIRRVVPVIRQLRRRLDVPLAVDTAKAEVALQADKLAKCTIRCPLENAVIVSPDTGRAKLAGRVSSMMDIPMVLMHKRRSSFSSAKITHVVGDIKDRIPIVIDDVVAGGSVLDSFSALLDAGARPEVYAAISHPVLVGDSLKKLDAPHIKKLVVSNTIYLPPEKRHPKIEVVSIATELAEVIRLVHREESITPVLSRLPGTR